jgi:ABC-type antimicrobial peptide transport system permease subunit
MLRHALAIAWRNLFAHKLFSLINIVGLAAGMTVSLLLVVYVYQEFTFDQHNVNSRRLFLAFKNQPVNSVIRTKYITPVPLAQALKNDFPEIAEVARSSEPAKLLVAYDDKSIKLSSIYADASWLDMFTVKFIGGDRKHALQGHSIILTKSSADALFGKTNAIGKVIKLNDKVDVIVTAVIEDLPQNSSFPFGAIISWESLTYEQPWIRDAGWDLYQFLTWVLLKPNVAADAVNARIKNIIGHYYPEDKAITLFLHPLEKLHLYNEFRNGYASGGRIEYVWLFLVLAIGILLIACINFMNLSTARSSQRAKEVGVKKTMGAARGTLVKQFLTESLLMTTGAFFLSICLLLTLVPLFNQLTSLQLQIPFGNVWFWLFGLLVTVVTGILAGTYPAFFLSSFNPIRVLKGKFSGTTNTISLRQVLVVSQFAFATALILASFYIYKQVNFIRDRNVGYDIGGLIEMPAEGNIISSFERFRKEAIESGAITDAAMTSLAITDNTSSAWNVHWPGQVAGEEKIPIDCMGATYHFTHTYGLDIMQGRDFETGHPSDSSAVLLNEAAVQLMRLKNPVGQYITWMGSQRTVIGVVKNFVWGSPFEPVKPAIIGFMPDWQYNIGIRLRATASINESLATLARIYKKYNPAYPFSFSFTDENFRKKYSDQQLLGKLSLVFTSLAILIAGLGLFGLASYAVEQRRKELGIRRVLGASVAGLWMQLSRQFVMLVLIAFTLGAAVSWYFVYQWLSGFAFHVDFSVEVFVVTLVISIFICLVAVSSQAIAAASAKPVQFLRAE